MLILETLSTAEQIDFAIRLFSAAVGGAALGLNRFLKHKAAGMRTHALTALGAALATLVAMEIGSGEAASRVIQGLVTGVGFIGAGVIMHNNDAQHIQGLTTAASIWVSSIIGIACGTGQIILAACVVLITLMILVLGRPAERGVARILRIEKAANDRDD